MSDLLTTQSDKGYYAVWRVIGTSLTTPQISLQAGWNLVGWATIEERPASEALSGIASDPEVAAWGFDELDSVQPWKYYAF